MADVDITYKGNVIASLNATGNKTLQTEGCYCEDDIEIAYTKPSGGITIEQFASGAKPDGAVEISGFDVRAYVFYATPITSIRFNDLSHNVGTDVCRKCTSLTTAFIRANGIGNYVFGECSNLETAVLRGGGNITSEFYKCSKLTVADVENSNHYMGINMFVDCTLLTTLILRTSDKPINVSATNIFNGSPFASGGAGGTIYIPEVLYNHLGDGTQYDYKANANWATIDGYGTITWAKIEGSYWATHYGDGTLIA